MAKLETLGRVLETDILVIGGGPAGLWAANRAAELGERVLIVDKGPVKWGGQASMSGGGVTAVITEEDVDKFVEELVYYYDGLCEQDLIEGILRQSLYRLEDMQRLGYEFHTEPDGKLKGIPQRGLAHITCYIGKPFGEGGRNLMGVLFKESMRLGVKHLGRIMVTDLLKRDGVVIGAVGFNTISGEFHTFKAGAIVLTTGLGGWKTSYGKNTATGEGMSMALRAGTELKNYEFMKVWNVPRRFGWEGQTWLLPLGARFINAKDEPFMEKYSPVLGANTDPHYIVRAMAVEAREGRGPFYIDCSLMKPEDRELMRPKGGWMKLNDAKLKEIGMDFFEQKLEWMPQASEPLGGVIADIKGRTAVPGLYAAGTARNIETGLYIGGWHLGTTAVTGYIAGDSAAEYTKSHKPLPIDKAEVEALRSQLYAPLGKAGISPKEVLTEVQEAFFPYDVTILKNEASLKKAINKIETIKDELLPLMGARDAHYLMKLVEVRGVTQITELFLRASLMRVESRAGHYREDYPNRDDRNWLKWIIISQKNGKLNFRTEPVPVERYKFKLTRYYMDNFEFPKQA